MPELPDITVYIDALSARILNKALAGVRVLSPFVLRSVEPPLAAAQNRRVIALGRIGKRIVISLEGDLHFVIHLMIAGRLRWLATGKKPPGKIALAAFDFDDGSLVLTEAGTTRRASLHLVQGSAALRQFDRGGIEPLDVSREEFVARLRLENHTLKRTLTDPRLFSGIGNSYSDEILHRARLSPMLLSQKMPDEAASALYDATRTVITEWIDRLRTETGTSFPEHVTAFREGMAVHGRYGLPCPDCGAPVQRIRYATNETNYCARCQTEGRLLADRGLSRLLKQDWPRSLDELELDSR